MSHRALSDQQFVPAKPKKPTLGDRVKRQVGEVKRDLEFAGVLPLRKGGKK